jgi:poly(hydroxyalkanoate) depolymerase family esterase
MLAKHYGFALLMPQQQSSNNGNGCFNWFNPEDTARDSGEACSIRQMIARMAGDVGIDGRRIFVTGLSAGAPCFGHAGNCSRPPSSPDCRSASPPTCGKR